MDIWHVLTIAFGLATVASFVLNIIQFFMGRKEREAFRAFVRQSYHTACEGVRLGKAAVGAGKPLSDPSGEDFRDAVRSVHGHLHALFGNWKAHATGIRGWAEQYLELKLPPWRIVAEDFESRFKEQATLPLLVQAKGEDPVYLIQGSVAHVLTSREATAETGCTYADIRAFPEAAIGKFTPGDRLDVNGVRRILRGL